MKRPEKFGDARRIVVKIGSSVLRRSGDVDRVVFASLVRDIAQLKALEYEVIVVCSGAVALGFPSLGFDTRPTKIEELQACAAVGQAKLMAQWNAELAHYHLVAAQVLLTHDDLKDRKRFLAARDTLRTLLRLGVIPVVNENDTVAIEEIKLGDNDHLSSQVLSLSDASFLILLSDTNGLFDGPPSAKNRQRIPWVDGIDDQIMAFAGQSMSGVGSGGMKTKLEAVRQVNELGVPAVIAPGKTTSVVTRLLAGDDVGTWFHADTSILKKRKHWIAYALKAMGTLHIDEGAVRAICRDGRSLLPIGLTAVDGDFSVGDAVKISDSSGQVIGQGLASHNSEATKSLIGKRSGETDKILARSYVVHRDDLVIF
ncbi:MAG: glutamate 5-kinase [Myxococcota bacterium]|nr:glutamate 5-kinase [Myxococcota bacterium]